MHDHAVLRVVAKLLIPFIFVFALYVQFHGDYGPGGGFQAGVLFAAGVILYSLIFGLGAAGRIFPPGFLRLVLAGGVILYIGVGLAGILLGGKFLDYGVLAESPKEGQHLGILLVELGVGLTVTAAMILIFFFFTGHDQNRGDAE